MQTRVVCQAGFGRAFYKIPTCQAGILIVEKGSQKQSKSTPFIAVCAAVVGGGGTLFPNAEPLGYVAAVLICIYK